MNDVVTHFTPDALPDTLSIYPALHGQYSALVYAS